MSSDDVQMIAYLERLLEAERERVRVLRLAIKAAQEALHLHRDLVGSILQEALATTEPEGWGMTNHELRLAAAKAAGYTIECDPSGFIERTNEFGLTEYWNPLEDDRDAFRLMVDCGLEVSCQKDFVGVTALTDFATFGDCEDYGTDEHAATRRAIVRAAAAMGVGE